MNIPLVDLKAQYLSIKDEIDEAIRRVLSSGSYVMGKEVEAFEAEWAHYCGAGYCVGCGSCTDALYLVIKALGCESGKILTTPATFFATTQAIIASGNRPMYMDVDNDGNIDVDSWHGVDYDLVIPVNLYGKPAPIPEKSRKITIEDAAQSHGVPLRGLAACHSFYPTKNLGAMGQAGAVVTNDKKLADKVRELRTYGERERFVHYDVTGNHRMDELQAAILRAKLPYLEGWNKRRREIAAMYVDQLHDVESIVLPEDHPQHVYHIFAIKTKHRDDLATYLKSKGIQTAVRYPVPMHLQPVIKQMYPSIGYKEGYLPHADAWARENLSLPMYPELNPLQVEYVCEKIKEWASENRNRVS